MKLTGQVKKAAKQVYTFPEPGDYLLRIENINASVDVDLINIPINLVAEF
jgi:hypothetical protein